MEPYRNKRIQNKPGSFDGIRAEVPVPVETINRVGDLLTEHRLTSLVAEHIRGEEHLDAEHTLGGLRG